jgi:hypothetical protein
MLVVEHELKNLLVGMSEMTMPHICSRSYANQNNVSPSFISRELQLHRIKSISTGALQEDLPDLVVLHKKVSIREFKVTIVIFAEFVDR